MCSHCPEFFTDFFYYSKLAENCTNSTVFGRETKICHLTVAVRISTFYKMLCEANTCNQINRTPWKAMKN